MIVGEHKQIDVTFTGRSRGQTSANILSGPTWNVFDTSPRFITALAAVHACECVLCFCVCQATARTPMLVGGSEGLLYRLNPGAFTDPFCLLLSLFFLFSFCIKVAKTTKNVKRG